MSLFAQIPDPTEAMTAAAQTENWVIILLVFIVLAMVSGFAYLSRMVIKKDEDEKVAMHKSHENQIEGLRQTYDARLSEMTRENDERIKEAIERENRMALRIDKLEDARSEQDRVMLNNMTSALVKVDSTLATFAESLTKFTDVQSQINGDIKMLCALLGEDGVCRMVGHKETEQG